MKRRDWIGVAVTAAWLFAGQKGEAATEVLSWKAPDAKDVTCIYGEITVLTSVPRIYFCGAEWYGVGGYCGIQHISATDRRMIFSIWDTSPVLHPAVTKADPDAIYNRFGNEGSGQHTHMVWNWKYGEPFQFFLHKEPGKGADSTDTSFYFFDAAKGNWRLLATINSPNGANGKGTAFGGFVSWIENIGGQANPATPKVALYRMWAGPGIEALQPITRTGGRSGSGRWGQLGDAYFLAEGTSDTLGAFFAGAKAGNPVYGEDGKVMDSVPATPLPTQTVEALERLLQPK